MSNREVLLSDLMQSVPMDIDKSVLPDDRVLVRNVIACLCTLRQQKIFHIMAVGRVPHGYHVIAKVSDSEDYEFSTSDLEVLGSVSPLRVTGSAFERRAGKTQIRVRILAADQPVNVTQTSVTHIRQRRRISQFP